jgi:transcriptional regulator with GAF, ATPase, and Fis domain
MGKQVDSIPAETMTAFQSYAWPGNIRELQNLVERAVIVARDGMLPNPLRNLGAGATVIPIRRTMATRSFAELTEAQRVLILETLEQVEWVVGGPNGAAAKLGLKRTTLLAKMKRMGISRPVGQVNMDVLGMEADNPEEAQL